MRRLYIKCNSIYLSWIYLFALGPIWTLIHEIGHAIAGWLLGSPPWAIRVGKGSHRHPKRAGLDRQAWNTPTGKTWLTRRPHGWRAIAILASGSLFEFVMAVALLWGTWPTEEVIVWKLSWNGFIDAWLSWILF